MYNLFVLDVVGHFAAIGDTAFEVARAGEVTRSTGEEDEVEGTTVVVELALDEGSVDYGEDPVEACYGAGAFLEFTC